VPSRQLEPPLSSKRENPQGKPYPSVEEAKSLKERFMTFV